MVQTEILMSEEIHYVVCFLFFSPLSMRNYYKFFCKNY